MPMFTALLAGCHPEPEPAAPPGPAEDPPIDPSPWTFTTEVGDPPPFDPDQLGRALDAAIPAILAYDAEGITDAYGAIWDASADATCPTTTLDPYGNHYWIDGCVASDGTYFGGYLQEYAYAGTYDPYAQMTYDGLQLAGNIVLDGPDTLFDLEGVAAWVTGVSSDGLVLSVVSAVSGGFYDEGADGWLAEPTAATVTLTGYTVPVVSGVATLVDGAVPVVVDGQRWDVWFHGASVGNVPVGSLCDEEPGGTVEIRDPWGRWVVVTFHGPLVGTDDAGDPARCDGCGDAIVDDELGDAVGSVCADFTPWFTWEKLP